MATELTNFLGVQVKDLASDPSFDSARLGLSADPTTGKLYKVTIEEWVTLLTGLNVSYAGAADTTTDPGTPDNPVYYTASTAGTYTNFKDSGDTALVVADDEVLAILSFDGTAWSKQVINIPAPENKIADWTATAFSSGDQVNHDGNVWQANDDASSSDIPGVSDKWSAVIDLEGTLNKVSDLYPGKNLIDKANIIQGKVVSTGSNAIISSPLWRITGYVPVEEGKTYTYSGYKSGVTGVGFFVSDGDTDAYSIVTTSTFTVPAGHGIGFVVANITNDSATTYDATIQLELGASATTYAAYSESRFVPDDKLRESYAKESEVQGLVTSEELFDKVSFNMIDSTKINFQKRYSAASKIITDAGVNLFAITDWIKVEEGEFYAISGGIGFSQAGGYFANYGDATPIDNITYSNPVTGSGKIFQVPTGQGINYVLINVATNSDHTETDGNVQMEHGEMATTYQPYDLIITVKKDLIPDDSGGGTTTVLDAKAWYEYTEGEMRQDMAQYMPNFRKHWMLKDKDLCVINTGTSLTARSIEHCTAHPKATERPPLMHSHNMASQLWDKIKWDNQFYRRYDFDSFFTESGAFNTGTEVSEWDDGIYRSGLTRYSEDSAASIAFQIPVSAWQFNFIYRTDATGSESVKITVGEGDGYVEVYDETTAAWVEANAYVFSMKEAAPVARVVSIPNPHSQTFSNFTIATKANTTYQKRLKMRCKSDDIDSRTTVKNVTIANQATGRFLYWGVEWSLRQYMLTFINAARGSYQTRADATLGLPKVADNEIWSFKPDLIFSELGIHNDGAGQDTADSLTLFENCTNNYVFNTDYELSMVTRSQALNDYVPEIIMFSATITWNFGGINADGTLKIYDDGSGNMVTCLDKFNAAAEWWWENQTDYGFINFTRRYVQACFDVFGDMKTATAASGKDGTTSFTDEGSHPNDTGSKIWAKAILGCFDFV